MLEFNRESVALVLTEFVRSDYARQHFNRISADGTDYGQVGGMFEQVELVDSKLLVVKLKRAFNERNEAILDRLSRYFRVRIPRIKQIHAKHRDGIDIL